MLIYNAFLHDGRGFELEVSSDRLAEARTPVFRVVVYRPSGPGRPRAPMTRTNGRPMEFVGMDETDAVESACAVLAKTFNSRVRISTLGGVIACDPPALE